MRQPATDFWVDRVPRLAGIAILVLVALAITDAVIETIVVGESNAIRRADVATILRDMHSEEALSRVGAAVGIVTDALALVLVAGLLHVAFRDRSRLLATVVLVALVAAGVAFVVADVAAITLGLLAADFVAEGGPGDIAAGDPAILASARAVAASWLLADLAGLVWLSFGIVALGALLATAPEGEVNPPRWLGGLAIVSGLILPATWLALANQDLGFAIGAVGVVGTTVFLVVLGGWLIARSERQPRMGRHPAVA